jgi:hypothetical protein
MSSSIAVVVLTVVLVLIVSYLIGGWLFKKDDAQERRAESYLELAGFLRDYGLKDIPQCLVWAAIKDYSSIIQKVKFYAQLIRQNPSAVIEEFDKIFDRILTTKLAKAESRALIAAKLMEAEDAEAAAKEAEKQKLVPTATKA